MHGLDTTLFDRSTLAAAGRERVQSMGRARKIDSKFVELIDQAEVALVTKARREQANMNQAMQALSDMVV